MSYMERHRAELEELFRQYPKPPEPTAEEKMAKREQLEREIAVDSDLPFAGVCRAFAIQQLQTLTTFKATVTAIECSDAHDGIALVLRIPAGCPLKAGDVVRGSLANSRNAGGG
jgi:hypothetical protein